MQGRVRLEFNCCNSGAITHCVNEMVNAILEKKIQVIDWKITVLPKEE